MPFLYLDAKVSKQPASCCHANNSDTPSTLIISFPHCYILIFKRGSTIARYSRASSNSSQQSDSQQSDSHTGAKKPYYLLVTKFLYIPQHSIVFLSIPQHFLAFLRIPQHSLAFPSIHQHFKICLNRQKISLGFLSSTS